MNRATLAAVLVSILAPSLALCQVEPGAAAAAPQATSSSSSAVQDTLDQPSPANELPAAAEPAPTPSPEAASPSEVAAQERPQRKVVSGEEQLPADAEWLVDAEGRSYYIRRYPKRQIHKRLENSRVRVAYGGEYDLAGENESELWLKVYRLDEFEPVERSTVSRLPSPEDLAASAATFVAPLATVDRLTLERFDAGLPERGLWRNGFDLADMNGDGKIDFVHGPPRRGGDQPRVFLGDGQGNWRPYAATVPSGLLDYGDIKVADFNGDGKPDIATANHLRGIAVFVGDGAGKFASWGKGLDFDSPRPGYDASGFSSRRLEVLDWNRDKKPDLLALSEGPRIAVSSGGGGAKVGATVFGVKLYINQGDGSWRAVEEPGEERETFGDDIAVADFDRDGRPDFVTSSNSMGERELLFLQREKAAAPWASIEMPVRPRAYVHAVAVADFDRDRQPDVAISYTSFELGVERVGVDIYLAGPAGEWNRRPVFVRDGRLGLSALDAGDVDGDKQPDLVALDQEGDFYLFLGDGKGGFALEESPEAQKPRGRCRGYGLRIADIGLDKRPEIIATYAGESNPLFDPTRCEHKGGVAAWTLEQGK